MNIHRLLEQFAIVLNYLMFGCVIIIGFGQLSGLMLYGYQETWVAPYITSTNVAAVGLIFACLAIFNGFKKYPGQDVRDVPRRRRSMLDAFFGCALTSHAGMLIEGTTAGTIFRIASFTFPCIAILVWSQNRLDSWAGRYRETTSPNSCWNTLGL